ncbi:unnamed protein product, partial [Brassica oleracea var. botrytis]
RSEPNGSFVGVLKRFWCGDKIVSKISKSDNNPHHRYYRCHYAQLKKLAN